jgi:hypothetical protein
MVNSANVVTGFEFPHRESRLQSRERSHAEFRCLSPFLPSFHTSRPLVSLQHINIVIEPERSRRCVNEVEVEFVTASSLECLPNRTRNPSVAATFTGSTDLSRSCMSPNMPWKSMSAGYSFTTYLGPLQASWRGPEMPSESQRYVRMKSGLSVPCRTVAIPASPSQYPFQLL